MDPVKLNLIMVAVGEALLLVVLMWGLWRMFRLGLRKETEKTELAAQNQALNEQQMLLYKVMTPEQHELLRELMIEQARSGVNRIKYDPETITHLELPEDEDPRDWEAIQLPELDEKIERFISEDHSIEEVSELICGTICELHAFVNGPTSPRILGNAELKAARNKVFSVWVLVTIALDKPSSETVDPTPS